MAEQRSLQERIDADVAGGCVTTCEFPNGEHYVYYSKTDQVHDLVSGKWFNSLDEYIAYAKTKFN